MTSHKRTVRKILLIFGLVLLPQFASAQTNTFPPSGSVGVGTTTPITDVEVKNSSHAGVTVNSGAGSTDASIIFQRGGVNKWFLQSRNSGAPTDSFVIYDGVNFTFPFVLTRSGNVGIGTTSPTHRFVVGSGTTANVNGNFGVVNAGGDQSGFAAVSAGQRTVYLFSHSSGGTYGLNAYDYGSSVSLPITINWSGSNTLLNTAGGNVGIGTTSPTAGKLQIQKAAGVGLALLSGSTAAGQHTSMQIGRTSADGSLGVATQAGEYAADAVAGDIILRTESSSGKLILNSGTGAATLVVNNSNVGIGKSNPTVALDVQGDIKASGTIHAKYQDLAEWVPSSEQLAAGTVVVLDTTKSNQVIASGTAYDTRVAGVISTQPGITLGESGEGKVLVATTGRVKVKVDASRGAIHIGDLLVTSDVLGVAMKSDAVNLGGIPIHRPGTIIGKALEPLAKGSGEILVLLSLQ